MINRRWAFFPLLSIFFTIATAQTVPYKHYTVKDGLAHSLVYRIEQGQNGFMWFGTNYGLTRFDGVEFRNYTQQDGYEAPFVIPVLPLEKGKILTGNYGSGLYIWEKDTVQRYSPVNIQSKCQFSNTINLFKDWKGRIWGKQASTFIYSISKDTCRAFRLLISVQDKDTLARKIYYVYPTADSSILIGTGNGLFTWNEGHPKQMYPDHVGAQVIYTIEQAPNGDLWLGGEGQIIQITADSTVHTYGQSLLSEKTHKITVDRSGRVWFIADKKELFILQEGNIHTASSLLNIKGVEGVWYNDVHQDDEGNIWISTYGSGVWRITSFMIHNYTAEHGLISNYIKRLDGYQGDIWVGTTLGVNKIESQNGMGQITDLLYPSRYLGAMEYDTVRNALWFVHDRNVRMMKGQREETVLDYPVKTLFQDSQGRIWFSGYTEDGFIDLNDNIHYLPDTVFQQERNLITAFYEDTSGKVWMGTMGEGLYVREPTGKTQQLAPQSGLDETNIIGITRQKNGTFWLATGEGLYSWKQGELTNFSTKDGLSHKSCNDVVIDSFGNLWIATMRGVNRFDGEKFSLINTTGGLLGEEVQDLYIDNKQNLWVGTMQGLSRIDLSKYYSEESKTDSIPINFTNVQVNEENRLYGVSSPTLPYNSHTIRFRYSGIYYKYPDKVRYHYQLVGQDTGWQTTTSRSVQYSNLPAGSYTFRINATAGETIKSPVITYSFRVSTPFWQTWWFIGICIFAGGGLTYLLIWLRTWQLERKKQLLEHKVHIRTKDLAQKTKELELANEELEKLSVVASKTKNAVLIADQNGKIEWVNDSFTEMTGYTLDEVKGTGAEMLRKGGKTGLSDEKIFEKVFDKKESVVYEAKNYTKEGEEYWALTTLTPIFDESGNVKKLIGVDSDITKIKEAEKATREAKKREEQFMASITHELRTPLNAITGMIHLLRDGKTDKSTSDKYLRIIDSSAQNLLTIINDILDLSKLQAGKMTFEEIPFEPGKVAEEVLETLSFKAEDKDIELKLDFDDNLPEVLIGDPVRLNQLILNLANNAIKFTEEGYVKVTINEIDRSDSEITLRCDVEDTGIGIPEEKQKKIFKSFGQAGSDTTRKFGGTGLGLSICKHLIRHQGGTINLESEEGEGSTFTFTLTYKIGEKEELEAFEEEGKPTSPIIDHTLRILLVEDGDFNREVATDILENWEQSVEVEVAKNGEEALEKVENSNYEIILMDVEMPKMNGYEATRKIRQGLDEEKSDVPIIALSAHASGAEKDECLEAGMDDYLKKPFEPSQLHQKVLYWVQNDRSEGQGVHEQGGEQSTESSGNLPEQAEDDQQPVTDLTFLRDFSNGDSSKMKKYIDMFQKAAPDELRQMQEAAEKGDWELMGELGHTLKPKCRYMGSHKLENVMEQLQNIGKTEADPDREKVEHLLEKAQKYINKAIQELREVDV